MSETKVEYYNGGIFSDVDTVDEESLSVVYQRDIRPFIDVIDQLRRLGINQELDLPTVVVVGDQSSGKSSIIEALSGIQLPRGKNIVTRCPLELQLKRIPSMESWKAHIVYPGKEICTIEPSEVEFLIRQAQNEICGSDKDVKDVLITLRIESPIQTAPDLTLIDLPGITRIAVAGQNTNVCDIIREMVKKYIKSPRTVILCMVNANVDFANNEALTLAKSVDPNHERTIGVITKPDLADESNKGDVLDILNNNKHALKKGYVMVKCRSQAELDSKITLNQSVENEKQFFMNDSYYRYADPDKLGTMNLATKISCELVDIIKKFIPDLKEQINIKQQEAQDAVQRLPNCLPHEVTEKRLYLTKMLWDFAEIIKALLLSGQYKMNKVNLNNLYYEFRQYFNNFADSIENIRKQSVSNKWTPTNLKEIIERNRGREINGFLSFGLFQDMVEAHVDRYKPDMVSMANNMQKVVEKRLILESSQFFGNLPELEKDVNKLIIGEVKGAMFNGIKEAERCFSKEHIVYTSDALFTQDMDDLNAREAEKNKNNNGIPTPEYISTDTLANAEMMQKYFKVYMKLVNKRLMDIIPLNMMQNLVVDLQKQLHQKILDLSMNTGQEDVLRRIKETSGTANKREMLIEKIKRLQQAHEKLTGF